MSASNARKESIRPYEIYLDNENPMVAVDVLPSTENNTNM